MAEAVFINGCSFAKRIMGILLRQIMVLVGGNAKQKRLL